MQGSKCCFLTLKQISQETGKDVFYSHLLKITVVIHTVKGFSIVNETELDVFLNSLAFSMIQWMLAIWYLVPLLFVNPAWKIVDIIIYLLYMCIYIMHIFLKSHVP